MKSMFSIRGTRLYVEQYNVECEEVLLYLHGGPGASCIDFCFYQAQVLSDSLRIIALDQRGVLRSDPIHEEEQFGLNEIIEDLEELRVQLGIISWNLLGHSFGGYLAVRYALLYPISIKRIIFETPCFDIQRATKSIISKAKARCIYNKNTKGIELCNLYLDGYYNAEELWNAMGNIFQLLGEDKDYIYFQGITPQQYNEIIQSQFITDELWSKNQIHNQKLQEEGLFFENLMPKLSELSQPTLLLTGEYDPVCCSEQQSAYLQEIKNGKIIKFEKSAHFPRLEEPQKYTNEVIEFITL